MGNIPRKEIQNMELSTLDDRLEEFHTQVDCIGSILEGVYDALQCPNSVPETYYGAIRGAAELTHQLHSDIGQLLAEMRME